MCQNSFQDYEPLMGDFSFYKLITLVLIFVGAIFNWRILYHLPSYRLVVWGIARSKRRERNVESENAALSLDGNLYAPMRLSVADGTGTFLLPTLGESHSNQGEVPQIWMEVYK